MKNPKVDNYTNKLKSPQKEIVEELRKLILKTLPDADEEFKWSQPCYTFGYIAALKDHVNLGFWFGAKMNDDKKLLEGTGKNLRHIKIRSLKDIKSDYFAKLMNESKKFYKKQPALLHK